MPVDPTNYPEQAALELTLALVNSMGPDLIRDKMPSAASADKMASFVITLNSRFTEHFKKQGK